jgi:hypothetical protein
MTDMGLIAFGAGMPEAIQPAGPRTTAVSTGQRITVVSHATGHRHDEAVAASLQPPVDAGAGDAAQFRQLLLGVGPGIVEFEQLVALSGGELGLLAAAHVDGLVHQHTVGDHRSDASN